MGRALAILLVMVLPAVAGEAPPGCAWLCGTWTLDPAQSDPAEALIDEALQKYEEPRPGGRQPSGAELRQELRSLLVPPGVLTLAEAGDEILIRVEARPERRLTPNRAHSRTDDTGTIEIRASWGRDDSLQVTETYDRRRNHSENYALQRDGTLVITREVERPGIKRIRARALYRRG
jgi:hypothetical protein